MRLFFIAFLISLFGTTLLAFGSDQPATLSEGWIIRPSPEPPSTDEEFLAVLVASEHKDEIMQNISVKYDGIMGLYETVTVITLPEEESDMQIISRYRIINNLISANTKPTYKTYSLPEKKAQQHVAEKTAYQLAVNANGINSDRPLISGDKMLAVTFDGRCDATVIEKDFDHEIVATYHFIMCD